jgi:hypothetical protein
VPAENAQKLNDAVSSKNNTIKILTTDDGGAEHAHVDNRQVGIDFTAGCSATICKARNEALAEVPIHKPESTTSSPSQQRFSTVPRLNLRYMAKPPQGFEVSKRLARRWRRRTSLRPPKSLGDIGGHLT